MLVWTAVLALSIAGSVGGLLVTSLLLLAGRTALDRAVPWLVSFAVGTLLGAALLGLVPEALEQMPALSMSSWLLGGILAFFILEKLVLWRHSHDHDHQHHHEVSPSTVTLVILGDAIHTFIDGIVIAAAALVSLPLGVTTAIAVAAHEIPQEAGDFAILLAAGRTRKQALLLNATSAIGGLLGALAMLMLGSAVPNVAPYVLAFAAGNFLYVAMADLIPHLHRGEADSNSVRQVVLIGLGLGTIWLVGQYLK